MNIDMSEFSDFEQPILAGSMAGRKIFSALVTLEYPKEHSEVCFFDFSQTDLMTQSCFRDSLLAFRDYCRVSLQNVYPVIQNANDLTLEEVNDYLVSQRDAFPACDLDGEGRVTWSGVLGVLDEKQIIALDRIANKKGELTASQLRREADGVGTTAWNNRLSALAAKGILMESQKGRAKVYKTVLEGLSVGR
ncbi:MAG: hypothetical protein OXH94_11670 [Rhodospirillales bacterium]|nr:hypothetical protein [Rhodospirillales bacterium]